MGEYEDRIEREVEIVGTDPKFPDYKSKVTAIFYKDGSFALSDPEHGCDGMFIYLYPEQFEALKALVLKSDL